MSIDNVRRHYNTVKALLHKYRHDSRRAAKALTGEMFTIQSALGSEIPDLMAINPDDRASVEQNAERVIAALKNYINEHAPQRSLPRKVSFAVGITFLVFGAFFLGMAVLSVIPVTAPAVDPLLEWADQPTSTLAVLGAPLTAAGGVFTGIGK